MNPLRFLVLSFTMCGLLSSARSQDSQAQAWIHQVFDLHHHRYTQQDLFVAGYQADQARDYDTAFDKLSRFDKANHDRLHAATFPDEKAFRTWLESRLNNLEEIRNSNGHLRSQPGGTGKGPGTPVGGGSSHAPIFSASATSDSEFSSSPKTLELKKTPQPFHPRPTVHPVHLPPNWIKK